ncbi:membrane protein [Phaeodactylibacter xiamenensis]|uniref:Membrane protein n=2 Tax=Phaeodactylibacter xiamenensis TaxID=1524460 RepID=A0A098S9Y3_9BACT|nr:membrane protein [Phaeodactylibacter xiamenensis]
MIVAGVMSLIGMFVSQRLKSKFSHYSQIPLRSGLPGYQIAQRMLDHYGIRDVKIVEGQGFLTDHYNPVSKTVSLSPDVYRGNTIAAAAVAAHECGHAVQHAQAYSMLQVRSALVPMVNISAMAQQWLLIIAFMTLSSMPSIMLITIAAFGVTALFSFITLPVEFDASKRALAWLESSGVTAGQEQAGAKDALWWAAMTYVSAALSALVMLLYLLMRYSAATRD